MANSALHAIAIEELKKSDPGFHEQYWKLVEGITKLVREIAKDHPDELDYTSFTESYDRASAEPVLQVVIGANKMKPLYMFTFTKKNTLLLANLVMGKE